MKIKICGIKTLEEARWAVAGGADFLGFNFYPPSPRFISFQDCCQIVQVLRSEAPNTLLVGVFVNLPPLKVLEILDYCDLDLAQLSGDESLEDQTILGERAYKALRLSKSAKDFVLDKMVYVRKTPPAFLVDASIPGEYGGTGKLTDWELAASLAAKKPIFLAGGLTAENIAEAVRRVKPWGVDVASGVEIAPGKKDRVKILSFVRNARQAFQELRVTQ
ncbi:MAG: phosphoribosylanthranilate isomerase [Anaerolineales bacterium]|nr:phosphoribosylanthranilate isomerase [Anaerolineales bacterium]